MRALVLALCVIAVSAKWAAKCPVSGEDVEDQNNFVTFKNGQRIYFCCSDCAAKFQADPLEYVRAPRDPVAPFLPDLTNTTVSCPVCEAKILVNEHAARIQLKFGQSIYFGCFNCVNTFYGNPLAYFNTTN